MKIPHNGTDTSKAAAEFQAQGKAQSDAAYILEIFKAYGRGHTCDEIEKLTGLSHQTASARINGLVRKRLIMITNDKRRTRTGCFARVYREVNIFKDTLF